MQQVLNRPPPLQSPQRTPLICFTNPTNLASSSADFPKSYLSLTISLALSLSRFSRSQPLASKMQSLAFSHTPTLPLPKPRRASNQTFNPRFDPIRASSSSKPHGLANVSVSADSPRRSWSLSSSNSFKLRPWTSVPALESDRDARSLEVRAASVPESAGESAESSSLFKTLELGALFGLWYLFNIYFNIYNKQVTILMDLAI